MKADPLKLPSQSFSLDAGLETLNTGRKFHAKKRGNMKLPEIGDTIATQKALKLCAHFGLTPMSCTDQSDVIRVL